MTRAVAKLHAVISTASSRCCEFQRTHVPDRDRRIEFDLRDLHTHEYVESSPITLRTSDTQFSTQQREPSVDHCLQAYPSSGQVVAAIRMIIACVMHHLVNQGLRNFVRA